VALLCPVAQEGNSEEPARRPTHARRGGRPSGVTEGRPRDVVAVGEGVRPRLERASTRFGREHPALVIMGLEPSPAQEPLPLPGAHGL
jgi:hypothetical protein